MKYPIYVLILSSFFLLFCVPQSSKISGLEVVINENDTLNSLKTQKNEKSNRSQIKSIMSNDTAYIIPLTEVYKNETIQMIRNKMYLESNSFLVMDFVILGDTVVYANNDRQSLDFFVFNEHKTHTLKDYPSIVKGVYQDEPKSIKSLYLLSSNNLFYSSFNGVSGMYDFRNKDWNVKSNKPNVVFARELDGCKVESVHELTNNELDVILSLRLVYDFFIDKNSRQLFAIGNNYEEDSLILYMASTKEVNASYIKADIEDVDIICFKDNKIYYVLKEFDNTEYNDVLVCYDYLERKVLSTFVLKPLYDYKTHFGEPGSFITGKSYKIFGNFLWRLRTTSKGVLFEKWDISHFL